MAQKKFLSLEVDVSTWLVGQFILLKGQLVIEWVQAELHHCRLPRLEASGGRQDPAPSGLDHWKLKWMPDSALMWYFD